MTRTTKFIAGAGGAFVLLAVLAGVAYANLTTIVRSVLEEQVPGLTFKELEVGWNKVVITDVRLQRRSKVVFKVDALRVYPSMWSIFSDTLTIASIDIDGPYVHVVRNKDGSLTLPTPQAMASRGAQEKPKNKGAAAESKQDDGAMGIHVKRFRLRDGKGELLDRSVSGTPATIVVSDLNVTVDDVAVPMRDAPIAFDIGATLAGKRTGKMSVDGWYNGVSQDAELEFELADLFMPTAEPYYRSGLTTAAVTDGVINLASDFEMAKGHYRTELRFSMADLTFAKQGRFLGVPAQTLGEHLQDQAKPIKVEVEVEGDIADSSTVQQQLLAAVVKAVAKEMGSRAVEDVANRLKAGDLNGAEKAARQSADKAGKALGGLFGQ